MRDLSWKPSTALKSHADYDIDLAGARTAVAAAEKRAREISDRFDRLPIGSLEEAEIEQLLASERTAVEALTRTVRRLEHGRQAAVEAAEEARIAEMVARARQIAETVPAKLEAVDKALRKLIPELEAIHRASHEYDHLTNNLVRVGRSAAVHEGSRASEHPYYSAVTSGALSEMRIPDIRAGDRFLWAPTV